MGFPRTNGTCNSRKWRLYSMSPEPSPALAQLIPSALAGQKHLIHGLNHRRRTHRRLIGYLATSAHQRKQPCIQQVCKYGYCTITTIAYSQVLLITAYTVYDSLRAYLADFIKSRADDGPNVLCRTWLLFDDQLQGRWRGQWLQYEPLAIRTTVQEVWQWPRCVYVRTFQCSVKAPWVSGMTQNARHQKSMCLWLPVHQTCTVHTVIRSIQRVLTVGGALCIKC